VQQILVGVNHIDKCLKLDQLAELSDQGLGRVACYVPNAHHLLVQTFTACDLLKVKACGLGLLVVMLSEDETTVE